MKNYFQKYRSRVFAILFIVIIGIAGYFVLSQKQENTPTITNTPNSNSSQKTQTSPQTSSSQPSSTSPSEIVNPNGTSERKSISSTLGSFTKYGNGTFSVPTDIQQGTEITLRWTSDKILLGWGDKVYICLIALDTENEVIERKENKELCYPDMQLILGTTTLSSGEYHWLPSSHDNEFVSSPKSFKLSVRILDSLPPEGRSEWAGLISKSTSNEFIITQ